MVYPCCGTLGYDAMVYSDGSGSWGCGAFYKCHWFQLEWPSRLSPLSITVKERCSQLSQQWHVLVTNGQGKLLSLLLITKQWFRFSRPLTVETSIYIMHLIQLLVFFAAKYDFWFTASHIPGKLNRAADALSRNNLSVFFQQAPQVDSQPYHVHQSLVSLLSQNITWTSEYWIKLFKDTLQLAAGLMPATHKTYLSAEKRYLNFCNSFSIVPLPTSEETLCYFVACLDQGLAHSTIRTYLSGICQLQIAHGFQDPAIDQMPRLCQVPKGVKVECGRQGKPSRSRLPIIPSILRRLKSVWMGGNPSYNVMVCITHNILFLLSLW